MRVLGAVIEIAIDGVNLLFTDGEFLERSGQGAHAAFAIVRQKNRQDVEEPVCVLEPLAGCPIRRKHLLLHRVAMEFPKRKAVNRKDVAVVRLEPAAKSGQRARLDQFA